MNQYYSEELSQKTKRGMNETRMKGNFIGGTINYGWSLKPIYADESDKKTLIAVKVIINEEEAPIVKEIFTDYANGKRICDIVRDFKERGITNRGKPFQHATIYSMLKQEKYTGIYRINGDVFDKIYPPIVPTDIYEIVRKKIDANKYGKHVEGVNYLLKDRIFCGYCGKPLSSYTGTSKSGIIWRYYKCRSIKIRSNCQNKMLGKEVLEKLVIQALLKAAETPHNFDFLVSKIIDEYQKQLTDASCYRKRLC